MKISYNQVESYCNELHSIAKSMKDSLQYINSIGNSVKGYWSGEASDYFSKQLNALTKNFDEVFCELENSILFMAKCSEGYQVLDDKISQEICNNLHISSPNLNTSNIFNGK